MIRVLTQTKKMAASQPIKKVAEVQATALGRNESWGKRQAQKCLNSFNYFIFGFFLAVTMTMTLMTLDRESYCKGSDLPTLLYPPCRATDINYVDVETPGVFHKGSPSVVTGPAELGPCNFLNLELKLFPDDTFCVFQNLTFQRWRNVKHYEKHSDGKTYVHVDKVPVDVVRTFAFKCARAERPYSQEYTGAEVSAAGQKMEAVVAGVSNMFLFKIPTPYKCSRFPTFQDVLASPGRFLAKMMNIKNSRGC